MFPSNLSKRILNVKILKTYNAVMALNNMRKKNYPDYNMIYSDLIRSKFPEKLKTFRSILQKQMSFMDVLYLNKQLFGDLNIKKNQKFRSYDSVTIFKILDFQNKYHLTNTQLADHFKLSRNTVTNWRRKFLSVRK